MSLKVAAYTISKNEALHVDRYCAALKEADGIFITDTGSTDDTVQLLQERGAMVQSKVRENFRLDVARNDSLDFVPEDFDVAVVIDLDETFRPGWRDQIEMNWKNGVTTLYHPIITSFEPDGVTARTQFDVNRVHSRKGYKWKFPCHERHVWMGAGPEIGGRMETPLEHRPDNSKPRDQYLPLLELFAKEEPESDRAAYYLGREYMYKARYEEAIVQFKRHIKLDSSTWNTERASSLRYIASIEGIRGNKQQQLLWLMRACAENPAWRDSWCELGQAYAAVNDWEGCYYGMTRAVSLTQKISHAHSQEVYWQDWVRNLMVFAADKIGVKR